MKRPASQQRANASAHIVSIGTTPPGSSTDLVAALAADLAPLKPDAMVLLSTADSRENARRLTELVGLPAKQARTIEVASAQSLDDAYRATGEAISALEHMGYDSSQIVVHFTGGTKVISAGMVLSAVSHECRTLRYLYSPGRGTKSQPFETAPKAVHADRDLRLARVLMQELRFSAAARLLSSSDPALLSAEEKREYAAVLALAPAYSDWDNFRVRGFLKRYRALKDAAGDAPAFALGPDALHHLDAIAKVEQSEGEYPVELVIDLYNNALRRMQERHFDDALIRLYRASELFAQYILKSQFQVRTDDLDVRRVPPRERVRFEALRRLEDGKIKLGLRKSYELLALFGHKVGKAFEEDERFQSVLEERRTLVLAHGTRPCQTLVALGFLARFEAILQLEIPDLPRRARASQFPWIDNTELLARLRSGPPSNAPPEKPLAERPSRRSRR